MPRYNPKAAPKVCYMATDDLTHAELAVNVYEEPRACSAETSREPVT